MTEAADAERAERFGRQVMGPLLAEFYLRLFLTTSFMEAQRPEQGIVLFCARGGLRLELGWNRFLAATALEPAMPSGPLMISRLAAIRPALARTVEERLPILLPGAARAVDYEFRRTPLRVAATALAGLEPRGAWPGPATAEGLVALITSPAESAVAEAITEQARLFTTHFRAASRERPMPVLVDTGLYGTTRVLLRDAYPALDIRCLLLAKSAPVGFEEQQGGAFGLSVEAQGYSVLRRRTALLRYWHFVEWLFEPDLESVSKFTAGSDGVRSNLERPDWGDALAPRPATALAGAFAYLDDLSPALVAAIPSEAARAWPLLKRAFVWPTPAIGRALAVSTRTVGFGLQGTWESPAWEGPAAALRGSVMWREGTIARSGGVWRLPLQSIIETAYVLRSIRRVAGVRQQPGRRF